jgi:hypothetical protein
MNKTGHVNSSQKWSWRWYDLPATQNLPLNCEIIRKEISKLRWAGHLDRMRKRDLYIEIWWPGLCTTEHSEGRGGLENNSLPVILPQVIRPIYICTHHLSYYEEHVPVVYLTTNVYVLNNITCSTIQYLKIIWITTAIYAIISVLY